MAEVVVFGTVAADIVLRVPVLPKPGDHIGAEPLGWRLGGSSANLAVALAADGHHVRLVSIVGSDDLAEHLLHELADRGVSTELCVRVDGRSPRALILLDPDGERTIIGLDRGSATDALAAQELPGSVEGDCVVVESYRRYPAQRAARDSTALVIATLPPAKEADWPADILIGSERQVPASWRADPFSAGRVVAGERLNWVVVTRAERGADAYGGDGVVHAAARPARQIDATGAGDAFAAGMITSLLTGRTMAEAMDVGTARGAAAVEVLQSVPPAWLDGERMT
jgi:ribokinase